MKVGAAWIKKNDKGESYMSISIELPFLKDNFIMVKNKDKKNSKEPDYILMWNSYKKANQQSHNPKSDDEIPF